MEIRARVALREIVLAMHTAQASERYFRRALQRLLLVSDFGGMIHANSYAPEETLVQLEHQEARIVTACEQFYSGDYAEADVHAFV